jgi:hypothetical protein
MIPRGKGAALFNTSFAPLAEIIDSHWGNASSLVAENGEFRQEVECETRDYLWHHLNSEVRPSTCPLMPSCLARVNFKPRAQTARPSGISDEIPAGLACPVLFKDGSCSLHDPTP